MRAARMEQIVRGISAVLLWGLYFAAGAAGADGGREHLVEQIRRADYEGDRAALRKLYEKLRPTDGEPQLASRVRYWRGFALWRRAINGFNDSVDLKEQEKDLRQAMSEFDAALMADPGFADAKIAEFSCAGLLIYAAYQQDPEKAKDLIPEARAKWKDAEAAASENPRFLWVAGPNYWRMGDQAKAMAAYEHGLEILRTSKKNADPLEPSWGEPELLMSLAWSYLNAKTSDPDTAEKYARQALEIVPYWHYVRDILMAQIEEAKKKQMKESRGGIAARPRVSEI